LSFHAADDAVLEAVAGAARGWGQVDGRVAISHDLVIHVRAQPPRDAQISGVVVDGGGQPIPDALVRAAPTEEAGEVDRPRAPAVTTTAADGRFLLPGLDRGSYELVATADDRAPVRTTARGGARGGPDPRHAGQDIDIGGAPRRPRSPGRGRAQASSDLIPGRFPPNPLAGRSSNRSLSAARPHGTRRSRLTWQG
jgi:hypothetical protein